MWPQSKFSCTAHINSIELRKNGVSNLDLHTHTDTYTHKYTYQTELVLGEYWYDFSITTIKKMMLFVYPAHSRECIVVIRSIL